MSELASPSRTAPTGAPPRDTVLRVLIAEDVRMVRTALTALLSLEPDIEVVAELERGDDAVGAVRRTQPAVAVVDIDLPGLDGLSAAERLHDEVPQCQVLMLTGLPQPAHVLRAIRAHVRGFMLKDAPVSELADAVRAVAGGRTVFATNLVARAVEIGDSPLTQREAEVLQASQTGAPSEQIARLLALSPSTVRNYLSNAITKIGARNRIEALWMAREAGWILPTREPRSEEWIIHAPLS